ncbi:hypothetical protein, partial [Methylogaea oryzae]|uniref:hypothetical protein n=1 Tax=Methylogaea oryzae TaxID=1295382 RepID=UPI0012E1F457
MFTSKISKTSEPIREAKDAMNNAAMNQARGSFQPNRHEQRDDQQSAAQRAQDHQLDGVTQQAGAAPQHDHLRL